MITKFMDLCAVITAIYGASALALPGETYLDFFLPAAKGLGATPEAFAAFSSTVAAGLLGCANGQYQAARGGPHTCKEFCKLFVLPMAIVAYGSYSGSAWDFPMWAGLTGAIGYFGYMY